MSAPPLLAFKVAGLPIGQGSKSAFANKAGGRPIMRESAKGLKPWRHDVKMSALEQLMALGGSKFVGEVTVIVEFTFPRPKSHHVAGDRTRALKPSAPHRHTSKPDTDKLERAILDALKDAGVIVDDSKVSDLVGVKRYGDMPGAYVIVTGAELDVALIARNVIHNDAADAAGRG